MKHSLLLFLSVWWSLLGVASAERAALVIGNNAYTHARKLETAVEDAKAVAAKLEAMGFNVVLQTDAKHNDFSEVVSEFLTQAKDAEVVFIYYAGHGMESQELGGNFLIPVDAELEKESHLESQAYALDTLLKRLGTLSAPVRMLVLDCCRNNPLEGRSWSSGRGTNGMGMLDLQRLDAATMVVYSASPGKIAKERILPSDLHGPFATALLAELGDPGASAFRTFARVERRVFESTREVQRPKTFFSGSLDPFDAFVFVPLGSAGPTAPVVMPTPKPSLPAASDLDRGKVGDSYEVDLGDGTKLTLQYIPPGEFMMGSPASEAERGDDEDQVKVTISQGYWMARTECTQAQWQALMESNPSKFQGSDLPVEQVSWEDAQQFIAALHAKAPLPKGWEWALPTEAQWEYACRAGTKTAFSFGNDGSALARYGNFADKNSTFSWTDQVQDDGVGNTTAPVMSYEPNGWGLYDMHGNVYEWCNDWYAVKLLGGVDPMGPASGSDRANRGGSWRDFARRCRSANRYRNKPTFRFTDLGFRPAAVPAGPR